MKQDRVKLALIGTGAWSGAIGDAMLKSKQIELVTCLTIFLDRSPRSLLFLTGSIFRHLLKM